MKKIFSLMMLASAVAFASCGNDGGEEVVVDITIDPTKPEMVAAEGATVTFTLNVDGAEAKSNQDWATPTVSGKELSVVVDENTESKQRSAIITVTKGEKSAKVTIKQGYNSLVPETTDVLFGYAAETKTIGVTASGPFTATASETWITATAKESSVEIKVAAATSNRSGTVELAMGSLKVTINVTQAKASYNDYLGTWELTSDAGTYTVTLTAAQNGSTYKGEGFSIDATALQHPITLGYDNETGDLHILGPAEGLGDITVNTQDGEVVCNLEWSGRATLPDGVTYFIGADNWALSLFYGQVVNGKIEFIAGTAKTPIGDGDYVEMGYYGMTKDGKSYYTIDGITYPFTMTKSGTSSMAPRNVNHTPRVSAAKPVLYQSYQLSRF